MPRVRIPWAPSRGDAYQVNTEIPRLMLEIGRQRAEGIQRGGDIWSRTLGDIGAGLSGALQQRAEQKQVQQAKQVERQNVGRVEGALTKAREPGSDAATIEASLPPELRGKFRESWARIDESENRRKKSMQEAQAAHLDYLGDLAAEVESFGGGPDGGVSAAKIALQRAKSQGVAEADQWSEMIAQDPSRLPLLLQAAKKASPKWQKLMGEEETRKLSASREGRELEASRGLAADRLADNTRGQATLAETIRHNRAGEIKAPEKETPQWAKDKDGNVRLMTPSEIRSGGATWPAAPARPPTGQQQKTLGFFNRAKQADDDLTKVEAEIGKMGLAGQTQLQYAPNWLQTDAGQKYRQSQRAFTEARLRPDSGAAIAEYEFKNDQQTYFVQPGDSAELIEQKRRARATVLASMGYQAGPALQGFYGDEAPALIENYKERAKKKPAGPAVGTRRTINGQLGEWDGKGWKAVR
jgi:hypothetical protein